MWELARNSRILKTLDAFDIHLGETQFGSRSKHSIPWSISWCTSLVPIKCDMRKKVCTDRNFRILPALTKGAFGPSPKSTLNVTPNVLPLTHWRPKYFFPSIANRTDLFKICSDYCVINTRPFECANVILFEQIISWSCRDTWHYFEVWGAINQ